MRQRFAQRFLEILAGCEISRARRRIALRRRRDRKRQRDDQQQHTGERQQRRLVAEMIDQADAERREQELTERSRRGPGAERGRAPARRQQLAERGDDQIERAARQTEADQHAVGEIQHPGRRGVRHHDDAERIKNGAGDDDADSAETIGKPADERLRRAVQQGLQRHRESEGLAAPAVRRADRGEERSERRARAEADRRDHAAAGDDHNRRAPTRQRT